MIVSAAFHSVMLLGIKYHAGSSLGPRVTQVLAGSAPFQARIDPVPPELSSDDGAAVPMLQDHPPTPLPPAVSLPLQQDAAVKPAPVNSVPPPESYYRAGDLDVRPQIMDRIMPVYPEAGVSLDGKVLVKLFINASGTVDEVAVVRAEPPGIFNESAIAAFSAARFTPGMKGHKAVKSMVMLEVNYDSALNALTGAR